MVSVLGPCYLLAGAELHGPEQGGYLYDELALSRNGSVCSVLWCTVVSQSGEGPVLFNSLGCLLLGVASPVFTLEVG